MSEAVLVSIIGAIALIITTAITVYFQNKKRLEEKIGSKKKDISTDIVPKSLGPVKKIREPLPPLRQTPSNIEDASFMSDDYIVNLSAELRKTLRPRDKIDVDFEGKE